MRKYIHPIEDNRWNELVYYTKRSENVGSNKQTKKKGKIVRVLVSF